MRLFGTTTAAQHPSVTLVDRENIRSAKVLLVYSDEVEWWMGWHWRACPWVYVANQTDVEHYVRLYSSAGPSDHQN